MADERESVDAMIKRQAAIRRGDPAGAQVAPSGEQPAPRRTPSGWMTFARIALLAVLVLASWSMGQIPPSELNAFGKLVAGSFFLALPLLYLLPTIEGRLRDQPNIVSIAVVNLLLGWTLVGWVVAMAWACTIRKAGPATGAAPIATGHAPAEPAALASVADEIRKLADLKAQGLLSDEEFAAQKAKVLAN